MEQVARRFAPLVAVGLAAACARQVAPPGGPEDARPPVVVATVPAPQALVTDLRTPVRFDFDERISERVSGGTIDQAISISPRSGVARVKHGRRALTLEVEGGLRPGVVYRVTLNAVVSDMFGNRITEPFELVFSTGGEPVATTLAGEVWNRVTGQPLAGATVLASTGDDLLHQSTADRQGIFAFRYLPDGSFGVTAFDDVNRNGEVDSTEVQGGAPATLAIGDTLLVDIAVLQPDTAAARATRAFAIDSVTIAVEFDDHLDPAADFSQVDLFVTRADGSAPDVLRIFDEPAYAAYADSVRTEFARLDSLDTVQRAAEQAARRVADSVAAVSAAAALDADATGGLATGDSAAVLAPDPVIDSLALPPPPDTVVVQRVGAGGPAPTTAGRVPPMRLEPLQGSSPGLTRDGRRLLPGRRLVALLSGPLTLDVEYEVTVDGVVNINGLTGGSGTAPLMRASPPPDTTGVDSLGIDTLAVDTLAVDTLSVESKPGVRR